MALDGGVIHGFQIRQLGASLQLRVYRDDACEFTVSTRDEMLKHPHVDSHHRGDYVVQELIKDLVHRASTGAWCLLKTD